MHQLQPCNGVLWCYPQVAWLSFYFGTYSESRIHLKPFEMYCHSDCFYNNHHLHEHGLAASVYSIAMPHQPWKSPLVVSTQHIYALVVVINLQIQFNNNVVVVIIVTHAVHRVRQVAMNENRMCIFGFVVVIIPEMTPSCWILQLSGSP